MPENKRRRLDDEAQNEDPAAAFMDDDDDDDVFMAQVEKVEKKSLQLNLEEWCRCFVINVKRDSTTYELIIQVGKDSDRRNDNKNKLIAACYLKGVWSELFIALDEVLSIKAEWDETLNAYKVYNEYGFCIKNPDNLIPITTVIGGIFCHRKTVLQDRFKCFDHSTNVMTVGTIIHELLQNVFRKDLSTAKQIRVAADDIVKRHDILYSIYSSEMTIEYVKNEIDRFLLNLFEFVNNYIKDDVNTEVAKDNFPGQIMKIKDIEENVWVPKMGLKGKIDATVTIHRHRYNRETPILIPYELKTGRATFSLEHRGQLQLYQAMLTAMGRETTTGLLHYLADNKIKEITHSHNEQRDLILMRNHLSYFFRRDRYIPIPIIPKSTSCGKFPQVIKLPNPKSQIGCKTCSYATLCCTFAKTDASLNLDGVHLYNEVMLDSTKHLQNSVDSYFLHWCGILRLEEISQNRTNELHTLWTETPAIRQRKKRALMGLKLKVPTKPIEPRFLNQLQLKEGETFTLTGFHVDEYVIVSTTKRIAIAAGVIVKFTDNIMQIELERDLSQNYANDEFIIDKYDANNTQAFNFSNLALLLENTEKAASLREIIIYGRQPRFSADNPILVTPHIKNFLFGFNSLQCEAILKAVTTNSYMLIKGLPGSGKTQTIIMIIRLLLYSGKTILVTSHTNSAVDNILLRLKSSAPDIHFLRLGAQARTHIDLQQHTEKFIMKDCNTLKKITDTYQLYRIVATTCYGLTHGIFKHRKFDYCIVDEATQVLQPTLIRPLFACEKFILVGDPAQLPPLIHSIDARKRGAIESLFHRLDCTEATTILPIQYRMNERITKLANHLTYFDTILCASPAVSCNTTSLLYMYPQTNYGEWLKNTVSNELAKSVVFIDTANTSKLSNDFQQKLESKSGARSRINTYGENADNEGNIIELSRNHNYCEAAIVFNIIKLYIENNYPCENIGVITTYRAQVDLLNQIAKKYHIAYPKLDFNKIEINTVDQYQGRDKDIIIYSCAKSNDPSLAAVAYRHASSSNDVIADKNRLTVAITRARAKLIIIGDLEQLIKFEVFAKLTSETDYYERIDLIDGEQEFSWNHILNGLERVIEKF